MKKRLLTILSLSFVAITTGICSVSYALFSASVKITQGAGSAGLVKKSVYLCPNIWEVDSPLYVMHAYHSTSGEYVDLVPSKTVSITVSAIAMDCKVFEFDTTAYDSFVFYRQNPSTQATWNQTDDIVSWDGSNNVYRITDWDNGYGQHNSGYSSYSY